MGLDFEMLLQNEALEWLAIRKILLFIVLLLYAEGKGMQKFISFFQFINDSPMFYAISSWMIPPMPDSADCLSAVKPCRSCGGFPSRCRAVGSRTRRSSLPTVPDVPSWG